MEDYTPEWRNKGDIADAVRRARLMMLDAHELRRASIECRHRAAVLRDQAQSLRVESWRHRFEADDPTGCRDPRRSS
jgi:hypothetical protein